MTERTHMTEQPLAKTGVNVLSRRMAYHARGEGAPVLFLHGNPTSSYLWRDVIPELEGFGRLIAPDLIGMGDSEKLPNPGPDTYRFTTHRDHLDAFIDALIGPKDSIVFVVHDWGSALGFDWANRHRDRVRGIAYMEGIVRPMAGWDEWSAAATPIFQGFRSDKGEAMILDRNMFVERVLPGSVLRKLSEAEMTEYRKPFLQREDRWPTLTWPADPDRRRARRRGADRGRLFAMDGAKRHPKTDRQCRPRRDPDRRAARLLPELEKSDRGHRFRFAFHPGGFRAGHRPGGGGMDEGEFAVRHDPEKWKPVSEKIMPKRTKASAVPIRDACSSAEHGRG
jgi:haloalkane dehalogenase